MRGSTPASTALLQSELDMPLGELAQKIGKEAAARVWWRSAQAVDALIARISDRAIKCDLRQRSTLYLPGNVLNSSGLRKETQARQLIGLRSVYLNRRELLLLSGIDKAGAIFTQGNGEADPVKLVAGLWRHFLASGGKILSNTEITDVNCSRSGVRLKTANGRTMHSKHAVFCNGHELMKFARPKGYKVISTWVMATKPQPEKIWRSKSLIWEAADPYLYRRSTVDGRIIAGGEDEAFSDEASRDRLIPEKISAIARKAQRLFPNANFTADYAWAGCFGESPNGLSAIGPLKRFPGCYAVLGFGGNGITFGMLASKLVSRHILGFDDPDASFFALAELVLKYSA
jgi:glycine/D-amino acid oxidase-like deaminating enzyme